MTLFRLILTAIVMTGAVPALAAASLTGTYVSEGSCRLTVESMNTDVAYADAVYLLRSDGEAACEWTGVGVAKRTHVQAGMVSGSVAGFVEMNWLYGPAGGAVEATFYGNDGKVNYKQMLTRE